MPDTPRLTPSSSSTSLFPNSPISSNRLAFRVAQPDTPLVNGIPISYGAAAVPNDPPRVVPTHRDSTPASGNLPCFKRFVTFITDIVRAIVQFFVVCFSRSPQKQIETSAIAEYPQIDYPHIDYPKAPPYPALSQVEYEEIWEAWAKEGEPSHQPNREKAVLRMKACLEAHADTLDLKKLNLTSLPQYLPPCKKLDVSDNQLTILTNLPEGMEELLAGENLLTNLSYPLPSTLKVLRLSFNQLTNLSHPLPNTLKILYLRHNQLTSLFFPLPPTLEQLWVSSNPLHNLPHPLPPTLELLHASFTQLTSVAYPLPLSLKKLDLYANELESLPPLPPNLDELDVRHNRLKHLPPLPARFKWLKAGENKLESLPEPLPATLLVLDVPDNLLTHLPILPISTHTLRVQDNCLTTLPDSLFALSPLCNVELGDNRFTLETLQTLDRLNTDPDYTGPWLNFSVRANYAYFQRSNALHTTSTRALREVVLRWLPLNRNSEALRNWVRIEKEPYASDFSRFLVRLWDTQSTKAFPAFKARVAAWLTRLQETRSLRQAIFCLAWGATDSCEDRVIHAYMDMQKATVNHDMEQGHYDDRRRSELRAVGREMFRLEKLEEIARAKIASLPGVDEIEVYLAYVVQLREPLGLNTLGVPTMAYFRLSRLTESDLQAACEQVKKLENQAFERWFIAWSGGKIGGSHLGWKLVYPTPFHSHED